MQTQPQASGEQDLDRKSFMNSIHFPLPTCGHLDHPLSVSVPFGFQDLFQAGSSEQCHQPGARGISLLCFWQQLDLTVSVCELGLVTCQSSLFSAQEHMSVKTAIKVGPPPLTYAPW